MMEGHSLARTPINLLASGTTRKLESVLHVNLRQSMERVPDSCVRLCSLALANRRHQASDEERMPVRVRGRLFVYACSEVEKNRHPGYRDSSSTVVFSMTTKKVQDS
jgi:hypothetical protein